MNTLNPARSTGSHPNWRSYAVIAVCLAMLALSLLMTDRGTVDEGPDAAAPAHDPLELRYAMPIDVPII